MTKAEKEYNDLNMRILRDKYLSQIRHGERPHSVSFAEKLIVAMIVLLGISFIIHSIFY